MLLVHNLFLTYRKIFSSFWLLFVAYDILKNVKTQLLPPLSRGFYARLQDLYPSYRTL